MLMLKGAQFDFTRVTYFFSLSSRAEKYVLEGEGVRPLKSKRGPYL